MNHLFQLGDKKYYEHTVRPGDFASFHTGAVHAVYSTFALARDAEWSGRLFVLEMKEDDEEGIGTGLTIEHLSPAFEGETVQFTATLMGINGHEIVTSYEASAGVRLIAKGIQKQKIIKKEKLNQLFEQVRTH